MFSALSGLFPSHLGYEFEKRKKKKMIFILDTGISHHDDPGVKELNK
jgi:hypothetical protein